MGKKPAVTSEVFKPGFGDGLIMAIVFFGIAKTVAYLASLYAGPCSNVACMQISSTAIGMWTALAGTFFWVTIYKFRYMVAQEGRIWAPRQLPRNMYISLIVMLLVPAALLFFGGSWMLSYLP